MASLTETLVIELGFEPSLLTSWPAWLLAMHTTRYSVRLILTVRGERGNENGHKTKNMLC